MGDLIDEIGLHSASRPWAWRGVFTRIIHGCVKRRIVHSLRETAPHAGKTRLRLSVSERGAPPLRTARPAVGLRRVLIRPSLACSASFPNRTNDSTLTFMNSPGEDSALAGLESPALQPLHVSSGIRHRWTAFVPAFPAGVEDLPSAAGELRGRCSRLNRGEKTQGRDAGHEKRGYAPALTCTTRGSAAVRTWERLSGNRHATRRLIRPGRCHRESDPCCR